MNSKNLILIGNIFWHNEKEINYFNGYLTVENGIITGVGQDLSNLENCVDRSKYEEILLKPQQFLIPGFVDCHVHAPQFPNLGLGLDRPLLEWLQKYTFPLEARYDDVAFAKSVYDKVVRRLLRNGTTTACYFGSLSYKGTLELAKVADSLGQRALVGKVSMNIPNQEGYYNETDQEIADAERFIEAILQMKSDIVEPIITPRFALSCDFSLMKALGRLAEKFDCRIQTHISENKDEIAYALKLYPECKSYADIYDQCGLLTNKTILAHAVYLTKEEIHLLKSRGASIVHCPASNTRLGSGLCPLRKLIDSGLSCGLGTDVSGGDSPSILSALRSTMDVSRHLKLMDLATQDVDWRESFYLATLGGAKALNLDHKIGSFEVGKQFDALLVDTHAPEGAIVDWGTGLDSSEHLLQRYIYTGNENNILKVFVNGRQVKY